jgi:hypothetical protein
VEICHYWSELPLGTVGLPYQAEIIDCVKREGEVRCFVVELKSRKSSKHKRDYLLPIVAIVLIEPGVEHWESELYVFDLLQGIVSPESGDGIASL